MTAPRIKLIEVNGRSIVLNWEYKGQTCDTSELLAILAPLVLKRPVSLRSESIFVKNWTQIVEGSDDPLRTMMVLAPSSELVSLR